MLLNVLAVIIMMFICLSSFNLAFAEEATTTSGGDTQITTTVSSTASAAEGFLSVNNIINILLITVGVVLILLAIAILSRLKKH